MYAIISLSEFCFSKEVTLLIDNEISLEQERLVADLMEFIDAEEVKELDISYDESFRIDNDFQASRLVKKYVEAKRKSNEINDTANIYLKRETEKINAWREKQLSPLANTMSWIENLLKEYAEDKLKDSKKKNLSFPDAKLQFKKSVTYEYDDNKLIEYLSEQENMDSYLKVSITPDKAKLKKEGDFIDGKLYINGKEIPGAEEIHNPDNFYIQI